MLVPTPNSDPRTLLVVVVACHLDDPSVLGAVSSESLPAVSAPLGHRMITGAVASRLAKALLLHGVSDLPCLLAAELRAPEFVSCAALCQVALAVCPSRCAVACGWRWLPWHELPRPERRVAAPALLSALALRSSSAAPLVLRSFFCWAALS